MNKKGILENIYPAVLTIVIIGIVLGIGIYTLTSVRDNTFTSTVDTSTSDAILADNGTASTLSQTPNSLTSVTTKNNSWLSFDGVNDYVNLSKSYITDKISSAEITVSLWVNLTQLYGDKINQLFYYSNTSSSNNVAFFIRHQTAGNLNLSRCSIHNQSAGGWADSDYRSDLDGANFTEGKWEHYICMYNGSDSLTYQNGILVNYTSLIGARGTESSNSFVLGSRTDGTSYPTNGSFDEVRLYNRSLTSSEILEIYNSGRITNNSLPTTGLVLWLPMNENSGTDIHSFNETDLT